MLVLVCIVVVIVLSVFLFLNYYPAFGGKSSKEQVHTLKKSQNFIKNKFVNQIPTSMDMPVKTLFSVLRDYIKGNPLIKPDWPIPVVSLDKTSIRDSKETKATWFGHSALLLEMEGTTLLIDPMLGETPSPFPMFGSKRYSVTLPIEPEHLPMIDAVILSHDHYDHLDYHTIRKLKDKVRQFIVPLGVGSHLVRWGVDQAKISEYDWWNELELDGLKLVCTPARHFSGRSLFNRDSTLWCSWVIKGQQTRIYYGGDSGYAPHFKEIGEEYGPFDLTFMECGQYDERWSAIHMMPEETVQAHIDVKGKLMIPIHWSAFTLALHNWTDPIERVTKAAKERNVNISTPRIGEAVYIGSREYPDSAWWRK
jgi:L-ascorbate metabolism protein UlaG (beta-lactamase superfamily)